MTFPMPTAFGSTHCTIEPQGDFGHPQMTLAELVADLRQRAANIGPRFDVPLSARELTRILDAVPLP